MSTNTGEAKRLVNPRPTPGEYVYFQKSFSTPSAMRRSLHNPNALGWKPVQIWELKAMEVKGPERTVQPSLLLSKLPLEIRDMIWKFLYARPEAFHEPFSIVDRDTNMPTGWDECRYGGARDAVPKMHLTCRQAYFETKFFLYRDVYFNFWFDSGCRFEHRIPRVTRKSMTLHNSLDVRPWPTAIQNINIAVTSKRLVHHAWIPLLDPKVTPNLKELRFWFNSIASESQMMAAMELTQQKLAGRVESCTMIGWIVPKNMRADRDALTQPFEVFITLRRPNVVTIVD